MLSSLQSVSLINCLNTNVFLKSTVMMAGKALGCGEVVAAVSGTICSSHLTSFLFHSHAPSPPFSLHVTQSPDYRMHSLSHPFHLTLPLVKECGRAALSRMHYAPLRHGSVRVMQLIHTKEGKHAHVAALCKTLDPHGVQTKCG